MYVEILRESSNSVETLAQEFFEKVMKSELPYIVSGLGEERLRASILRNFMVAAEAIGYKETARKHSGHSPCFT